MSSTSQPSLLNPSVIAATQNAVSSNKKRKLLSRKLNEMEESYNNYTVTTTIDCPKQFGYGDNVKQQKTRLL